MLGGLLMYPTPAGNPIHMDDLFRLNLIFIMVVVFPFLSRDDNLRVFISYSFASFNLDFSFVTSHWNIIKMEREKKPLEKFDYKETINCVGVNNWCNPAGGWKVSHSPTTTKANLLCFFFPPLLLLLHNIKRIQRTEKLHCRIAATFLV